MSLSQVPAVLKQLPHDHMLHTHHTQRLRGGKLYMLSMHATAAATSPHADEPIGQITQVMMRGPCLVQDCYASLV